MEALRSEASVAASLEYSRGFCTPHDADEADGRNESFGINQVEALREAIEQARAARGPALVDWRSKAVRPGSARYMRPRCRVTPDGAGGAPLVRPSSAPSTRRPGPPKTERWRESGLRRWPKESEKIQHPSDPSDGDGLRRGHPEQPNWNGELWIRSLRRDGIQIQDPSYHDMAQRGVRELQEEWQAPCARPQLRRPHSARAGYSRQQVPYGGSTSGPKVALRHRHDVKDWIERPVATGKMSLKHMNGQRYVMSQEPRYLQWEEYIRSVNPSGV